VPRIGLAPQPVASTEEQHQAVRIGSGSGCLPQGERVSVQVANGASEGMVTARAAGLRYVNNGDVGFVRIATRLGFRLESTSGKAIASRRLHERVRRLVIPPAWTDVWICADTRGHIQAIGRDARGRKQYIYHPKWRDVRDRTKFDRLVAFGRALPRIRARVDRDLGRRRLTKERVLAAIVSLLDATHVRIGNEEYARSNGSFGLTTFRNHHVTLTAQTIVFRFRAKSGKQHRVSLSDRRLARIVKACQDLPGQQLFQYLDGDLPRAVTSEDVNDYLRRISGEEFTAKDFRTWAGTVLAGAALCDIGEGDGGTATRRNLMAAIRRVAARLGNTAAVCRKCYIHPAVIDAYEAGALLKQMESLRASTARRGVSAEEAALLTFLTGNRRRRRSVSTKAHGPRRHRPPSSSAHRQEESVSVSVA
jgi:DNA topoisomerase-1